MTVYYLLFYLNEYEKNFFFRTISNISSIDDIDNLIKNHYYRVWKPYDSNNITMNTFILETWIFLKEIWIKYWVKPNEINWIYLDNLVILNDDLWLFKNNNWLKVSDNENTYFFTSRYPFYNPFWFLWEKLSKINKNFPKLICPNKELDSYYRDDKINYIINVYERREEILWNFMLSLFKIKWIDDIKRVFELWKKVTWTDNTVLKGAWGTDNWKHIKLLNINELLVRKDMLDYIKIKFIDSINEFWSNIYFTDYFEIKEEIRLYFAKNKDWNYKIYSIKNKVNLTWKEELYFTDSFSTWWNIKVKWELWVIDEIDSWLFNISKYILEKNNKEASVVEFVITNDSEIRFLEINNLWGSLMFEWIDEENIKSRISDWWKNLLHNSI